MDIVRPLSSICKGTGTWSGGVTDPTTQVLDDDDWCYGGKVTLPPLVTHSYDAQQHVPKTYATRHGALLLFSDSYNRWREVQQQRQQLLAQQQEGQQPDERRRRKRRNQKEEEAADIVNQLKTLKELRKLVLSFGLGDESVIKGISAILHDDSLVHIRPGFSASRYTSSAVRLWEPKLVQKYLSNDGINASVVERYFELLLPDVNVNGIVLKDTLLGAKPKCYKTTKLPKINVKQDTSNTRHTNTEMSKKSVMVLPKIDFLKASGISPSVRKERERSLERLVDPNQKKFWNNYENLSYDEKADLLLRMLVMRTENVSSKEDMQESREGTPYERDAEKKCIFPEIKEHKEVQPQPQLIKQEQPQPQIQPQPHKPQPQIQPQPHKHQDAGFVPCKQIDMSSILPPISKDGAKATDRKVLHRDRDGDVTPGDALETPLLNGSPRFAYKPTKLTAHGISHVEQDRFQLQQLLQQQEQELPPVQLHQPKHQQPQPLPNQSMRHRKKRTSDLRVDGTSLNKSEEFDEDIQYLEPRPSSLPSSFTPLSHTEDLMKKYIAKHYRHNPSPRCHSAEDRQSVPYSSTEVLPKDSTYMNISGFGAGDLNMGYRYPLPQKRIKKRPGSGKLPVRRIHSGSKHSPRRVRSGRLARIHSGASSVDEMDANLQLRIIGDGLLTDRSVDYLADNAGYLLANRYNDEESDEYSEDDIDIGDDDEDKDEDVARDEPGEGGVGQDAPFVLEGKSVTLEGHTENNDAESIALPTEARDSIRKPTAIDESDLSTVTNGDSKTISNTAPMSTEELPPEEDESDPFPIIVVTSAQSDRSKSGQRKVIDSTSADTGMETEVRHDDGGSIECVVASLGTEGIVRKKTDAADSNIGDTQKRPTVKLMDGEQARGLSPRPPTPPVNDLPLVEEKAEQQHQQQQIPKPGYQPLHSIEEEIDANRNEIDEQNSNSSTGASDRSKSGPNLVQMETALHGKENVPNQTKETVSNGNEKEHSEDIGTPRRSLTPRTSKDGTSSDEEAEPQEGTTSTATIETGDVPVDAIHLAGDRSGDAVVPGEVIGGRDDVSGNRSEDEANAMQVDEVPAVVNRSSPLRVDENEAEGKREASKSSTNFGEEFNEYENEDGSVDNVTADDIPENFPDNIPDHMLEQVADHLLANNMADHEMADHLNVIVHKVLSRPGSGINLEADLKLATEEFLREHLDQVGETTENDSEKEKTDEEDHEKTTDHVAVTDDVTKTTNNLSKESTVTPAHPKPSEIAKNDGLVTASSGEKVEVDVPADALLTKKEKGKAVAGTQGILKKDPEGSRVAPTRPSSPPTDQFKDAVNDSNDTSGVDTDQHVDNSTIAKEEKEPDLPPEPFRVGTAAEEMPVFLDNTPKKPATKKTGVKKKEKEEKTGIAEGKTTKKKGKQPREPKPPPQQQQRSSEKQNPQQQPQEKKAKGRAAGESTSELGGSRAADEKPSTGPPPSRPSAVRKTTPLLKKSSLQGDEKLPLPGEETKLQRRVSILQQHLAREKSASERRAEVERKRQLLVEKRRQDKEKQMKETEEYILKAQEEDRRNEELQQQMEEELRKEELLREQELELERQRLEAEEAEKQRLEEEAERNRRKKIAEEEAQRKKMQLLLAQRQMEAEFKKKQEEMARAIEADMLEKERQLMEQMEEEERKQYEEQKQKEEEQRRLEDEKREKMLEKKGLEEEAQRERELEELVRLEAKQLFTTASRRSNFTLSIQHQMSRAYTYSYYNLFPYVFWEGTPKSSKRGTRKI